MRLPENSTTSPLTVNVRGTPPQRGGER